MIGQETIQRIMDATRIEEVIGEFVSLRKRGTNWVGCCPFHNEKTPSFSVSPTKGIYKCFGCGESGSAVGFLMKHEHYSYPEALKWLAAKYNIEVEEEQLSEEEVERNNERDALFHVSEFAQKYFAKLLYEDEDGVAIGLSYLQKKRGLSDKVIKDFGLGYCLDKWDDFTNYARSQGYSDKVLEKTGLTIFKDDGKQFDRFRGRVMFPIYSVSGRVLGFSGRVLSSEKQSAKYVNSPDSEIYNKSRILYGLYQARTAIARQDKVYLVEGNVDVISMYQSGVENTVASCGTSLTVEQVRLMHRFTNNVTVLYDGDNAGIKAAFRAVNMLFEEGMHVRVVLFPEGEDPDSYARENGSTKLQEYLKENETNFILFKTKVLASDVKNDPIKKAEVLKEIVRTIALVPDLIERTEYVKQCASLLQTPEQTLHTELANVMEKTRRDNGKYRPDRNDKDLIEQSQSSDTVGNGQEVPTPNGEEQPQQRTPVKAFTVNPDEYQERKIVSLLLNNGNETLKFKEKDEEGKETDVNYTVAQVIVGDIVNDELTFENPVFQTIFNEYAKRVTEGSVYVDSQMFVDYADEAVRDAAISMMMEEYHISDQWSKKHINVPTPQERINVDVRESLLSFKLKKLDCKISELDRQFSYVANEEDKLMLMAQKMHFLKLRQQIGGALRRVIT